MLEHLKTRSFRGLVFGIVVSFMSLLSLTSLYSSDNRRSVSGRDVELILKFLTNFTRDLDQHKSDQEISAYLEQKIRKLEQRKEISFQEKNDLLNFFGKNHALIRKVLKYSGTAEARGGGKADPLRVFASYPAMSDSARETLMSLSAEKKNRKKTLSSPRATSAIEGEDFDEKQYEKMQEQMRALY